MNNINSILINNNLKELEKTDPFIKSFAEKHNFTEQIIGILSIVCDELLSNIIFYGFTDKKNHEITVSLSIEDTFAVLKIIYDGIDFDPRNAPKPDLDSDIENRRIGGLGIHIVIKMTEYFDYKRIKGKNYITIKKKI